MLECQFNSKHYKIFKSTYFFDVVRNKLQLLNMLIERRSKVQERNMSRECASNFHQWKTFSENYKPMSLILPCLQIYQELLLLMTFLRVHSNSKEVSYFSWQNTYPNLKTTRHIKLKKILWSKLLENLLLAKSVAVPLNFSIVSNKR